MSFPIAAGGQPQFSPYKLNGSYRLRNSTTSMFLKDELDFYPLVPSGDYNGNGNTKWTISMWVKRNGVSTQQTLFQSRRKTPERTFTGFGFLASGSLIFGYSNGENYLGYLETNAFYKDPIGWYHIVAVFDTQNATSTERMRLYVNGERIVNLAGQLSPAQYSPDLTFYPGVRHSLGGLVGTSTGYTQTLDGNICEVNMIDGQALTPDSFGEYNQYGVWQPKKYLGTYGNGGSYFPMSGVNVFWAQSAYGTIVSSDVTAPGSNVEDLRRTTNLWYSTTSDGSSFTIATWDLVQARQLSSLQIASLSFSGGTSSMTVQYSNDNINWTTALVATIGASAFTYTFPFRYSARYVRLRMTSFGTNGRVAMNGFWPLSNDAGLDQSGRNNNYYILNGSPNTTTFDEPYSFYVDYTNDVPTLTDSKKSNYCTLNNLEHTGYIGGVGSAPGLISEGGITYEAPGSGTSNCTGNFIIPSYGKWKYEVLVARTPGGTGNGMIGFAYANIETGLRVPFFWSNHGLVSVGGTSSIVSGASWSTSDILGIYIDQDNKTLSLAKNDVLITTYTSTDLTIGNFELVPYTLLVRTSSPGELKFNFGQRGFVDSTLTGYNGLGTQFLRDSIDSRNYFSINTFTGTGSPLKVTTGFSPDLVMYKERFLGSGFFNTVNTVRGNTKSQSINTSAEQTNGPGDFIFETDGFTSTWTNNIGYVAWSWKKSRIAGCDIQTYTGDGTSSKLINHDLGVAPTFMLIKRLDVSGRNWVAFHRKLRVQVSTATMYFSAISSLFDGSNYFPNNPTSSTFEIGSNIDVNASGGTYLAYLWTDIPGFSKTATWTGNGNQFGPYVYCGFRPKYLLIKDAGGAVTWVVVDTVRDTYNPLVRTLYPDQATAVEGAGGRVCLVTSNGFSMNPPASSPNNNNVPNNAIVVVAFADVPFKYSLGR